jgi:VIT1/CCC1 family predicted Fe2+/Mn2+ transporter
VANQLAKYARDEYEDYLIYEALAKAETDERRRAVLKKLSQKEYEHYLFWRDLSGFEPAGQPRLKAFIIVTLRRLLGLVFVAKLLEIHERSVVKWYKQLYQSLTHKDQDTLIHIISEEEEHEKALLNQIEESIINYVGYIALGLSDAIIEITGVHAGFLGATNATLIAGVAGLVVGFAASISMAAASYMQAKHARWISPLKASVLTGATYMTAVIILALPYLLIHDMLIAFATSLALSVVMISAFTFYGAVLRDESFKRELLIGIALTLGTAGATFMFGELIADVTNIRTVLGG